MTHEIQSTRSLERVVVRSDEGEARWWFESLAVIKATAANAGGLVSILEITELPGAITPLHVHHRDDEGFWILEGSATFEIGGKRIEARSGDYLFGPRGLPHRYFVGEQGCRILFIVTPGGFENLVTDMSQPAASRTLPPPNDEEPDWQHIAAVAEANGCDLIEE